jgi:methylated-DNA-[protein]-cysteine S-methyltransferase
MSGTLRQCFIESPIGELTLIASEVGLRRISWPHDCVAEGEHIMFDEAHPILAAASKQLQEYFAGDRRDFTIPLDLEGTDFQRAAWLALADVPYGETASYGEQAERIGRPRASRAVGAANGKNPVPIVLPCHRIVGADGSLTGFAGGLEMKERLLAHERAQQSLDI